MLKNKDKDKDKAVWEKFALLERKLDSVQIELNDLKKTEPELLKEVKSDSRKTSSYRNKSEAAMNTVYESLKKILDLDVQAEGIITTLNDRNLRTQEVLTDFQQSTTDIDGLLLTLNGHSDYISSMVKAVSEKSDVYEKTMADIEALDADEATESTERIKNALSDAQIQQIKLNGAIDKVFGYTGDEGHVDGLLDKLEKSYKGLKGEMENDADAVEVRFAAYEAGIKNSETAYNDRYETFISTREKIYLEAQKRITTLFSPAMNAGLAAA